MKNRTNRFHLAVAIALSAVLVTVAYAAVEQTIKGSLTIKGPSLTVTDPTVAARTFSLNIGEDNTAATIKASDGGLDLVLNSDTETGTSVQAGILLSGSFAVENYDPVANTGRRIVKYTKTLSGGNVTGSFTPAGSTIYACSTPAYAQSTVRSFAINLGYVPNTRTYTIKLGGGGTTNDAVTGTCWVSGPVGAG